MNNNNNNNIERFMKVMDENGDGGWSYETAKKYIGQMSLEEAIDARLREIAEYNRGIQAVIDAGYDVEFLLRKPK